MVISGLFVAAACTQGITFKTDPNGSDAVDGKLSYAENLGIGVTTMFLFALAICLAALHYHYKHFAILCILGVIAFSLTIVSQWWFSQDNIAFAFQYQAAVLAMIMLSIPIFMKMEAVRNKDNNNIVLTMLTVPWLVFTLYDSMANLLIANIPSA